MNGDLIAELSRLKLDPAYEELLKDKRVIVVGPAQTLLGSRQGGATDAYDLVVRFNTVIEYLPFTAELAADVGTRTDILYCNNEILIDGILHQRLISHKRFARLSDEVGIKYLVSTNNNFTYQGAGRSGVRCYAEQSDFRRFLDEQGVRLGFRMLFSTPDLVRRWLSGHIGRTGFLAIVDLLCYRLSRLHITGMTFYHQGGHLFLKDSISELHPLGNHRGELPTEPHVLGHNSYLELEVMRALAQHFRSRLEFDAGLQARLEHE